MLGNLIGGFIVILVGVTLAPTVADQVDEALNIEYVGTDGLVNTTVTGSAATILDLVVLFYCLGVASAGIAIAATGLRAAGMLT